MACSIKRQAFLRALLQPHGNIIRGRSGVLINKDISSVARVPPFGGYLGMSTSVRSRATIQEEVFHVDHLSQPLPLQTKTMSKNDADVEHPYWQKIPRWQDVSRETFLSYCWQVSLLRSTVTTQF
jgi:hypothetical protein